MKEKEEIQAELKRTKDFIARDAKAGSEQELAEEIQALLSEAIEAAASDDRDRLVSIIEEIEPLSPVGLDLTTRVKQLLEAESEKD